MLLPTLLVLIGVLNVLFTAEAFRSSLTPRSSGLQRIK